ncbi:hypothetical protein LTR15_002326 [Elasticomyces elasticus]|nr:hypothetical protein LTR15_002326 [Elasticomyces elasticus]
MAMISVADWFGKDKYSDVTLRFGDREFRAHRLVLEQSSKYFKQILDENTTGVVKLEDDPEAIECMLRYIYTFKYFDGNVRRLVDWRFHLRVAEVAWRYGVGKLLDDSVQNFKSVGSSSGSEYKDAHDKLALLPKYRHLHTGIRDKERNLQSKYFLQLLQMPEYRSVSGDPSSQAVLSLGRLATALVEIQTFAHSQRSTVSPYTLGTTIDNIVLRAVTSMPLAA